MNTIVTIEDFNNAIRHAYEVKKTCNECINNSSCETYGKRIISYNFKHMRNVLNNDAFKENLTNTINSYKNMDIDNDVKVVYASIVKLFNNKNLSHAEALNLINNPNYCSIVLTLERDKESAYDSIEEISSYIDEISSTLICMREVYQYYDELKEKDNTSYICCLVLSNILHLIQDEIDKIDLAISGESDITESTAFLNATHTYRENVLLEASLKVSPSKVIESLKLFIQRIINIAKKSGITSTSCETDIAKFRESFKDNMSDKVKVNTEDENSLKLTYYDKGTVVSTKLVSMMNKFLSAQPEIAKFDTVITGNGVEQAVDVNVENPFNKESVLKASGINIGDMGDKGIRDIFKQNCISNLEKELNGKEISYGSLIEFYTKTTAILKKLEKLDNDATKYTNKYSTALNKVEKVINDFNKEKEARAKEAKQQGKPVDTSPGTNFSKASEKNNDDKANNDNKEEPTNDSFIFDILGVTINEADDTNETPEEKEDTKLAKTQESINKAKKLSDDYTNSLNLFAATNEVLHTVTYTTLKEIKSFLTKNISPKINSSESPKNTSSDNVL